MEDVVQACVGKELKPSSIAPKGSATSASRGLLGIGRGNGCGFSVLLTFSPSPHPCRTVGVASAVTKPLASVDFRVEQRDRLVGALG